MREQTPNLVSPATIGQVKGTLADWDTLFPPGNPTRLLNEIYTSLRNCLAVDSKYGTALIRLHQLELDLFRVRYQEYLYLSGAPQEVQDAAGQLFPARDDLAATAPSANPGWRDPLPGLHEEELEFFLTQEWSAILKRLNEERIVIEQEERAMERAMERAREPPRRPHIPDYMYRSQNRPAIDEKPVWERGADYTTLINLCQTLGRLNRTPATAIVEMIEEYVERTTKCRERSLILEYAGEGRLGAVASTLREDLKSLDSVPEECYEHVLPMRDAMDNAVARLAEVYEWDLKDERRVGWAAMNDSQW
ncbi:hypothetical protein V8C26DRAFT_390107 [Trichoderma gracile]